jgi:hypothetical protein
VFLVNSRLGLFSATLSSLACCLPHPSRAPLLPKLRGHFAEFLNEGSLARLRILSLPTCVGLRYGHLQSSLGVFLASVGSATSVLNFPRTRLSGLTRGICLPDLPTGLDGHDQRPAAPTLLCSPSLLTACGWYRNFHRLSIAYAVRLGLGPD